MFDCFVILRVHFIKQPTSESVLWYPLFHQRSDGDGFRLHLQAGRESEKNKPF